MQLTVREFRLLEVLAARPERTSSPGELAVLVWGPSIEPRTDVVDRYVGRIRERLGPDVIETAHDGYRIGVRAQIVDRR